MKIELELANVQLASFDIESLHITRFFFQVGIQDELLNQVEIQIRHLNLTGNYSIILNDEDQLIIDKIWGNQGIATIPLLKSRYATVKNDESIYGKIMREIYYNLIFWSKDNYQYYWYYGINNISGNVYKRPIMFNPAFKTKHFEHKFLNYTIIENGTFKNYFRRHLSHDCHIINIDNCERYETTYANFGPPLNSRAKFIKYFDLNLIWGQNCQHLVPYLTHAINQVEKFEKCELTKDFLDLGIVAHYVFRLVLVNLLHLCKKYPHAYVFSDNQYLEDSEDEVENHKKWKTKLDGVEGVMFKRIYQGTHYE